MPLPPTHAFLASVTPAAIDNARGLSLAERALALTVLRLFFGPAQQAGAVRDVSEPNSLRDVATIIRRSGERFEQLVEQTSLPSTHFDGEHRPAGDPRLYAARQDNGEHPPAYFLYESHENLVLYVGPDFLHDHPEEFVVNCLVLDGGFRPTASHTLRL